MPTLPYMKWWNEKTPQEQHNFYEAYKQRNFGLRGHRGKLAAPWASDETIQTIYRLHTSQLDGYGKKRPDNIDLD